MRLFSVFDRFGRSMRRKLFGYMLLLALLLLLALACGLLLFGHYDSARKNAYEALDIQMEVFEKDVASHFERLAAAAIRLSEDTTVLLEDYLAEKNLSFADLNDVAARIASVQELLMEPMAQKMQQEDCSGIFVLLDATVNRAAGDAEKSNTGVYLQRSGYKNSDESVLLYRGLTAVAKRHGIVPHRKWQLEFRTDVFPNYAEIAARASQPLEKAYLLTDRFTLPRTSDDAVLMALPIVGSNGEFYGVCGFEVSASYFVAYHAQPTKITHLTCLLAQREQQSVHAAEGLSCGTTEGYYLAPRGDLTIKGTEDGLLHFSGEEISYVGVAQHLSLFPGDTAHMLSVMMPKADYDRAVMRSALQNIILWVLLLFFAVSCCLYFSKHFLSPILKALEQMKSEERARAQSPFPEINDLFVFLAEQDRQHESSLDTLEQEKQSAQTEKARLEQEYERTKQNFEAVQAEYFRAQTELEHAKRERDRLAYSRKNEIDSDDYQHFLEGVKLLTKTERKIFDLYLSGKTAKEILEISGIKESTLKFHNHNILSKLGVSSRKQMLRFAALMNEKK